MRGGPAFWTSVTGMTVKPCEVCRQSSYRVRNLQKSVRSGSGFQTSRYRESGRPCAVAMLSWPPREKNAEKCVRWPGFPDLCDRNVSETVRGEPSSSSSAPEKEEKCARWSGRVATSYGIRRKACAVGQDFEPPGTGRQEVRAQWQCFRNHREKRTRKTMRGGPSPGSSATGKAEKPCEVGR